MSDLLESVQIRPFSQADQDAARALILAGLKDRFGSLDPYFNRDLDDIWANYLGRGDRFLVAMLNNVLVGTGALIRENAGTGRIVRMSVSSVQRRQGIGRLITRRLIELGRETGYTRLLLETNDTWDSAIRLYQSCGFVAYDRHDGEVHMSLELEYGN